MYSSTQRPDRFLPLPKLDPFHAADIDRTPIVTGREQTIQVFAFLWWESWYTCVEATGRQALTEALFTGPALAAVAAAGDDAPPFVRVGGTAARVTEGSGAVPVVLAALGSLGGRVSGNDRGR